MQELLSVAVGPRTEEELPATCQVEALLQRLGDTLVCRKVQKTGPHKLIDLLLPLFSTRSSVCVFAQFSTVVSEQMLVSSTVLLACKLGKRNSKFCLRLCNALQIRTSRVCSVSAELPLASALDRGDGVVAGPGSGSEDPVRAVLVQLVELWEKDCCSCAPLQLLFTPLTVTAVLNASETEVTFSETSLLFCPCPIVTLTLLLFSGTTTCSWSENSWTKEC